MSYEQLPDFRFEGRSNGELSTLIAQFNSGDTARAFGDASNGLRLLAAQLEETDATLRRELGKLGVAWQGAAGDKAGTAFKAEADYGGRMNSDGETNSTATMVQSESNSSARNNMPPPATLNGATETSFVDDVGGFFGYETDHAKEVKATNAAREQAIQGLTQYTEASRGALEQFQVPGMPPNFEVTSTSSSTGTPVGTGISGIGNATPGISGGSSAGSPVGGVGSLPGGSVLPPAQLPGGGTVLPPGGTVLPPGGSTGIAPPTTGVPSVVNPPLAAGLAKTGGLGSGLGIGLGLAGVGLGAVAATAKGAQVVRGTGGLGTGAAPKVPVAKSGVPGVGGNGTIGGAGRSGAAAMPGALADGDERAANRGAGAAAAGGRGGAGSMMQPAAAAGGRGAQGDEDDEHVRKYGVDSDDVFGDDRLVVQSVIGEEPENK